MRKGALLLVTIGLTWLSLIPSPAQAQPARTWVSGAGNDANPCSRLSPCKTFQGAHDKTAAGGEINCLDPGDFAPIQITKAITISCEAGTAGILGTVSVPIYVNAAPTDVVTLRGLDIDGQAAGNYGIQIASAKEVHVEKCTIRNFRQFFPGSTGIIIFNPANTLFLYVVDTVISDNASGILFYNGGGFKVASLKNVVITGSAFDGLALVNPNIFVNVTDSVISGNGGSAVVTVASSTTINIERSTMANNGAALNAAASGSTIRASGNSIYNNTTGIFIVSGATIQSDGTNRHGNSNGGGPPNASLAQY